MAVCIQTVGSLKGKEELFMIFLHLNFSNLFELGKQVKIPYPFREFKMRKCSRYAAGPPVSDPLGK